MRPALKQYLLTTAAVLSAIAVWSGVTGGARLNWSGAWDSLTAPENGYCAQRYCKQSPLARLGWAWVALNSPRPW
jgi:hypothetical protein